MVHYHHDHKRQLALFINSLSKQMTTTQIISEVAQQSWVSKKLAKEVIQTLQNVIINDLKEWERAVLHGFGIFKKKTSTRLFNLPTCKWVRTVTNVSFKASKQFKKSL